MTLKYIDNGSNGRTPVLTHCPACGYYWPEGYEGAEQRWSHLSGHDPEDFGLSQHGEVPPDHDAPLFEPDLGAGPVATDGGRCTSDTEQPFHKRRASKDRDEWIDEDGTDLLPVFVVSRRARKFHKRYGGCTDPEESTVGYDLFAAEMDGYEPCNTCFADDRYVETESGRDD